MAASPIVRMSLLAAVVVVALTGCVGTSASPSSSPSDPSGSSAPPSNPTDGSRPTGSSSPVPVNGQCDTASLSGSIASGGGGAAGSVEVTLVLTNNGKSDCALQGWPGVSFVGDGNGTQLGKAADLDRSTPHAIVMLAAGGSARAALRIGNALNYSSADCKPQKADGFRVYPPGSTAALFVKYDIATACASDSVSLLTVGALTAS